MSFNVGASGTKDELSTKLEDSFTSTYPEPALGVEELFGIGVGLVSAFAETSSDEGNYSASVSGHAKQNDNERDSLAVSIAALM